MASADHRTAAEIEREIEEERNALSRTLDEIHDRLSFEALTGEFVDRVRENGGDLGRGVARAVRDNPLPLALTAMGLAWLVANQRTPAATSEASQPAQAGYAGGRGVVDPAPLLDPSGRPLPRDGSRWDAAADEEGADAPKDEAAGRVSQAAHAIRQRAESAGASAADLRRRIAHGTDEMSAEARKRVIAARTRAYEAQLRAEKYAARGREKAVGLFDEQPLVAGALALAIGAAIGGMLPRTRHEDGAFGAYRDRVFGEAERIYREESSRLGSVAREAAREMQDVARDVAADVGSDLQKGAQDATDVARAKLSDATGTAEPDRDGSGSPKLRQV